MEDITISSTSRSSAEADPIVIRLKGTVRLVFLPMIVNNANEPAACVKGTFVYQKKTKDDDWENIKELNLSSLRSGEGVQLEIKSSELLILLRKLSDIYRIHRREGIQLGTTRYVKISDQFSELEKISEKDLRDFLEVNQNAGVELFRRLATWLSRIEDQDSLLNSLESFDSKSLKQLHVIAGLGSLRRSLATWEAFKTNSDEEFWQKELTENSLLLSQVFAYPVVLLKGKAYVGGKSYENQGGNIVDFLFKNEFTDNVILIEIKTPVTSLIGKKYREGVYNVSEDLTGAILQVTNYANSITQDFHTLTRTCTKFEAFKPHCLVIAGNCSVELNDSEKRKSFELFRRGLKDVDVVTYDELFGKVHHFISLLEGNR